MLRDGGPGAGSAARPKLVSGVRRPAAAAPRACDPAVVLAERALHDAGLRFGTDGSTRALWGYLRLSHDLVPPAERPPGRRRCSSTRARPATASPTATTPPTTSAWSRRVAPDGRIVFVEARGGRVRAASSTPRARRLRRNAGGDIANSFLRAKAVDDPPGARYFAGEMLCGVARPGP